MIADNIGHFEFKECAQIVRHLISDKLNCRGVAEKLEESQLLGQSGCLDCSKFSVDWTCSLFSVLQKHWLTVVQYMGKPKNSLECMKEYN